MKRSATPTPTHLLSITQKNARNVKHRCIAWIVLTRLVCSCAPARLAMSQPAQLAIPIYLGFSELAYRNNLQEHKRSVLPVENEPNHCPACFWIWDTAEAWRKHCEYCKPDVLLNMSGSNLRFLATLYSATFYKPGATAFPVGARCLKLLTSRNRPRAYEPCLRRICEEGLCSVHKTEGVAPPHKPAPALIRKPVQVQVQPSPRVVQPAPPTPVPAYAKAAALEEWKKNNSLWHQK